MQQKELTKEEQHSLNQLRFNKTAEEKAVSKKAKSEWKKSNSKIK